MKKYIFKLGIIAAIAFTLNSCTPGAVVVKTRPETPYVVRPVAPSPSHVWVDGEWVLRNNHYVYKEGYWVVPARRKSIWVNGHWQERRGGWYWVSGHWK